MTVSSAVTKGKTLDTVWSGQRDWAPWCEPCEATECKQKRKKTIVGWWILGFYASTIFRPEALTFWRCWNTPMALMMERISKSTEFIDLFSLFKLNPRNIIRMYFIMTIQKGYVSFHIYWTTWPMGYVFLFPDCTFHFPKELIHVMI